MRIMKGKTLLEHVLDITALIRLLVAFIYLNGLLCQKASHLNKILVELSINGGQNKVF